MFLKSRAIASQSGWIYPTSRIYSQDYNDQLDFGDGSKIESSSSGIGKTERGCQDAIQNFSLKVTAS